MGSVNTPRPHLSSGGAQHLEESLAQAAAQLPGCFLSIATAEEVLFEQQTGPLDIVRGRDGPQVDADTIIWLSSATRTVVSLAYLQLVDRGVIALDAPLADLCPELAQVSRRVLVSFDSDGQPVVESAVGSITLRTMLNGTCGFGAEYSPLVKQWKAYTDKGAGQINSCKAENLIYTPPIAHPGERWEYGTSSDWLSFIFPAVAGQDLESYLQTNIFAPLGVTTATFYPHDSELVHRVMPLVWRQTAADGSTEFVPWTGQDANHHLPTRRSEMEYPSGGSGLYASARDFTRLLQNVLAGYQHAVGPSEAPTAFTALLSPATYKLAVPADLQPGQTAGMVDMMNSYFVLSAAEGDTLLADGDVNANLLNLPIYVGRGPKAGWGRGAGSSGWGGAAGTDFYIDPTTGIVVFFSTQALPGSKPEMKQLKKVIEKAVYSALERK